MRPIARLYMSGLLLVLALSSCRRGPAPGKNAARLIPGDYLSSTYIDALRTTHSPLKAGKKGGIDLVQVAQDGKATSFMAIYNFHDGGLTFQVSSSGRIKVDEGAPSKDSDRLEIFDDRTFTLAVDAEPQQTYRWVGKVEDFVATQTVAGHYQDAQGRAYEFKENGEAIFPDRKFYYEVQLDHVLENLDYFGEKQGDTFSRAWAFETGGDILKISPLKEGENSFYEFDEKAPKLMLRRVK